MLSFFILPPCQKIHTNLTEVFFTTSTHPHATLHKPTHAINAVKVFILPKAPPSTTYHTPLPPHAGVSQKNNLMPKPFPTLPNQTTPRSKQAPPGPLLQVYLTPTLPSRQKAYTTQNGGVMENS